MKRTFVVFRQLGDCPMNDDPIVGYIHGTNADAQKACNSFNKEGTGYYYYMDLDDLKRFGFEV